MLHNLRTIALLMLVAGVSVGVFASTLVARKASAGRATLDQKIEQRVKLYREWYGIDAKGADEIRRALQEQRRKLRDLIMALREQHAGEFKALEEETQKRIETVLGAAAR